MTDTPMKTSQIHVRVTPEFKKAVKMFCVREGTTEQAWVLELIEAELAKQAPDLWSTNTPDGKKPTRSAGEDFPVGMKFRVVHLQEFPVPKNPRGNAGITT